MTPPASLVRAWLAGRASSRGHPGAEERDGLLRTRVGAPGRDVEYVVLDADRLPRRIDLAARLSLDDRDPWITVPTADPGRVADRLAEHGLATATAPDWLMTRSLTEVPPPRPPGGYRLETTHPSPGSVVVHLLALDGSTAATGRLGLAGEVAVPDLVATARGHRRRGLGSTVMAELARRAVAAGATRGVLMASDQGRRLYLELGWQVGAAVVAARRR